jgi:hypothetical protein
MTLQLAAAVSSMKMKEERVVIRQADFEVECWICPRLPSFLLRILAPAFLF